MNGNVTGTGAYVFVRPFLLAVSLLMLNSCTSVASPPTPGRSEIYQEASGQITPVLPASDIAVGKDQRFVLALIGPDNRLITDAAVEVAFFKVTGQTNAQLRSRATTTLYPYLGIGGGGMYVVRSDFDEAGEWGIAALVARPGEPPIEVRASFQVRAESATPGIGNRAPASRTQTSVIAEEIEKFSSARPVDVSLYQFSIHEALQQKKPLLVLFATPGFCTSRTCGPTLEVFQGLHQRLAGRANFIHVEIYKDGKPGDVVAAVKEWNLPSEPWLFVIDAEGRVADKFEGSFTTEEVLPRLAGVIGME